MADIRRAKEAAADAYPILKLNEASTVQTISKSAAFTLELTGGDYKTAILMSASAARTVTFAVGNGIQGAGSDVVVNVAAENPSAIVIDSGYFKNVSGADKDCVKITPNGATTFTIFELPQ